MKKSQQIRNLCVIVIDKAKNAWYNDRGWVCVLHDLSAVILFPLPEVL